MNNEQREVLRTNVAVVKMHSVQRRTMDALQQAAALIQIQRDTAGVDFVLEQAMRDLQHLRSELIAGPIYCEEGEI